MNYDSSAPMSARMRRALALEVKHDLNGWAGQLRKRYDDNAAAGRLIDDDGDEHGCPTKGPQARCRQVQEEFTLDPDGSL